MMEKTKGNLLLIDDELELLEKLEFILEDLADQIFTAPNGQEALQILNEQSVHCVVCDLKMPGMDGIEVIKKARENGSRAAFIFYSGHGSDDHMLEVSHYYTYDFIMKPQFEGLEDSVKNALRLGLKSESDPEFSLHEQINQTYQELLDILKKD